MAEITRREFMAVGPATVASAASTHDTLFRPAHGNVHDAVRSIDKIALEEHFVPPDMLDTSYSQPTPNFRPQIVDVGSSRIAEMDRGGVRLAILSLSAPGPQAVPDPPRAIEMARRANDYLAERIAPYPTRLQGFAALPMQDAEAAARELTRCVKELGFRGALVNGFSQANQDDSALFYDLPQYRPFWSTVEQLGVPFYLHPRASLPSRQQAYDGHPWFVSSAWGFAVETSIHALRLMASGLFDEHPNLRIILGHLGEGLPFSIWRVDHRMTKLGRRPNVRRSMREYLRENFFVTTSGNFDTPALAHAITELGSDRVLYSVDYPFEDTIEASEWISRVPITHTERVAIEHGNAEKLFDLSKSRSRSDGRSRRDL